MAEPRTQETKSVKERLWNIAQAAMAGLLVASIAGGYSALGGFWTSHRESVRRIDAELAPINGQSIRDSVLSLKHDLGYEKQNIQNLTDSARRDRDLVRQQIEALARMISNIHIDCERNKVNCDYGNRHSNK